MNFPHTHAANWEKRTDRHVQPILGHHLQSLSPSLLLTGVCQAACPVCLLLLLVISFVGKVYYICCSLNYGKVVCAQFKQAPVLLFINIAHASCLSNTLLCSHTTFVHSCRLCQQGFDGATKEFLTQTNSTERIDQGAASTAGIAVGWSCTSLKWDFPRCTGNILLQHLQPLGGVAHAPIQSGISAASEHPETYCSTSGGSRLLCQMSHGSTGQENLLQWRDMHTKYL